MWTNGNYRRIFLDMHLADWNEEFLSKLDMEKNVEEIAASGAQSIVVKGKPHTGLCYWPTQIGRMHKGLRGKDYVGEMTRLCHEKNIAVETYLSLVFDNWAYETHPAWRMIHADGTNSMEEQRMLFRDKRYGLCCPNNPDYSDYVQESLKELCSYDIEGIFLDMPFWPDICCCPACKERYRKETGREIPKIVDWDDPQWREFQFKRETWMSDFMVRCKKTVKDTNPDMTVEFNAGTSMFGWRYGSSEYIMRNSDYSGGDYYHGLLQQSIACKYYKNCSQTLPFCYITSRCDPDLNHHTTTKTAEEFLQHNMIALIHDGAFSICDGMNPDGTICSEAYAGPIGQCFAASKRFEPYIGGNLSSRVMIWFADHHKYSYELQGQKIDKLSTEDDLTFSDGKIKLAANLRQHHIPFDVISDNCLASMDENQVLVISDVLHIRDEEMEAIEAFLNRGGKVYLSGAVGHPRLLELLEAEDLGLTEHSITYMRPTKAGEPLILGCSVHNPMSLDLPQRKLRFHGDHEVLATLTLPYTLPDEDRFAAIHSNPPGVDTDIPSLVRKQVGEGTVLWSAAAIERQEPYMSRRTMLNILKSMYEDVPFMADAPSYVEICQWEKNGKTYFAAVNEQEQAPLDTVYHTTITVPYAVKSARLLEDDRKLVLEPVQTGTMIHLPPYRVFLMLELVPKEASAHMF